MRHAALLVSAFTLLCPPSALAADEAEVLAQGRKFSTHFLERQTGPVWAAMTPRVRQALVSHANLEAFRLQVASQLGDEVEVVEEKVRNEAGFDVYLRTSRWSRATPRILMQWAFDDGGKIAGFFVRPEPPKPVAAPSTRLDYPTRAKLRLPFDGEWLVFWGGRSIEQNYHAVNRGQRFAYDLLVVKGDRSYAGNGTTLTDYYCWDQPILAPAAGKVVAIADGLPDQKIGSQDPSRPAGNYVVIDLGNSEFAFLAHLKKGSVIVQVGDELQPGQALGRCGNSGNTTEPHLHFHLQDTPRLGDGEGLPAFFTDYVTDDKPVARGEPVKGQRIKPK